MIGSNLGQDNRNKMLFTYIYIVYKRFFHLNVKGCVVNTDEFLEAMEC